MKFDCRHQTTKSSVTDPADQPVITGETAETDDFGNNSGIIDVTFESTQGNDGAWLYLSRGDDPYGLFYQTPLPANSPYIDGDGGAIPALSRTSTDEYNWDATFYLPASSQNVSIQIGLLPSDGIPLSTPVNNVAVGFYPGDTYAPPPAPILTPTLDSSGDLTIAYTGTPPAAGNNGGGTSFYAVTGPTTAVPLIGGTDYTDNGDGTITIANGSTYSGDPIFAATFEWLFYYGDESPYWSPYSNYVDGVGAPPTTTTTLSAPSDFTAQRTINDNFVFHWQGNSNDEGGYELQVQTSGGSWLSIATVAADTYFFTEPEDSLLAQLSQNGGGSPYVNGGGSPTTQPATTQPAPYLFQAVTLPPSTAPATAPATTTPVVVPGPVTIAGGKAFNPNWGFGVAATGYYSYMYMDINFPATANATTVLNHIYNHLRTFDVFQGGATTQLMPGAPYPVVIFSTPGLGYVLGPNALTNQIPVILDYNKAAHEVFGVTANKHVLVGVRERQVWDWVNPNGTITARVATSDYDSGNSLVPGAAIGKFFSGVQQQVSIWEEYLHDIADAARWDDRGTPVGNRGVGTVNMIGWPLTFTDMNNPYRWQLPIDLQY